MFVLIANIYLEQEENMSKFKDRVVLPFIEDEEYVDEMVDDFKEESSDNFEE